MKKSKLYTRTGDKGETSLVGGQRVSKASARINLYGNLDELNSYIGLSLCYIQEVRLKNTFKRIQDNIFVLGSNFASLKEDRENYNLPKLKEDELIHLEEEIDYFDTIVDPLKYFILPGGGVAASHIHICRTKTREVERQAVDLGDVERIDLEYLNRLSDYFFIVARFLNKIENIKDVAWVPNK
ncbi:MULTISPECIES: cob(I)yrinic acid a,c-diamide adenosyltransferase [Halobacteriovorax]|uniref:Corrinoid adenosyltransferase n=1 Tax=Halobacteriovorax vibrionivorans TaxID=2152716 RepID=A0ABY0IJ60_9BACT|nr:MULTISPECIES: cob(I)yrinic acid a,c-diamide adenosyltransferase [Halobacteriovorax]AYF45961.1 ATP:cob(I)alamin adenosyltransferase [Halobacteriovorax sp. BALOs_7]RZF22990.1 cob(I)yrinic acid a,c-diamide adenosyltransferase [Halobacteriovorax vibrionivorans]TGD46867.1 cob(I)yrinic acid a,c-diamide adenosyltransferase [Halobacteriovorax sp. Y22]